MKTVSIVSLAIDNGGRRSGLDRRRFSYSMHLPERRGDKDRRSGVDRRNSAKSPQDAVQGSEGRMPGERRAVFLAAFQGQG